jgi:GT2 family glycosyltransferase
MSPAERPELSVVIPCLNGADTLGAQLDALARQEWAGLWEVVFVDNGSTDGSRELAESYRDRLPNLRVVDASERRSCGLAMNKGVREALGNAVAFADADDVVGEGWVAAMGEALRRHDFVAGSQDDELLNEPWVRATRERHFAEGVATLVYPPHAPYTGAGTLGVRRSVFLEAGGFDERFYLGDVEFCIRLYLRGVELVFVPEAVIHYRYRSTLGGIARQAYRYGRGTAAIQRRYKARGVRFPGQRKWLIKGWRPALPLLLRVLSPAARGKLAWILGWQAGRYRGSVEHRVLAV